MNELFSLENKYRKQANTETITDEFGNKKILVGVLDRVSTDTQAIEGDSLEMQRELAQEYVKSIDGEIYKFYTEEGISASKTRIEKRQKLQELIQDIRDGNVNYVVAYKRDRIFRNAQEYMWFIQFLVDHNCEIYLTAHDEQQIDLSAFKIAGASKLMEVMMAMISEMESETTSSRVSDTMINLAKKGEYTGGSTPIGYRRENGKFVPMDGVKDLFNTIEELYLRGYGKFSIARWLNGGEVKGLKTLDNPIPKPIEHKTSEIWNHRNIETILFNPIYTGHFSYQSKKNIELDRLISKSEIIEPIRTEERQREISLFKIQKTSNSKAPRTYNTPFLLSGLLYCGECGEKMITSTSQPKGSDKTHSYYRCASKAKKYLKDKCSNKNYKKESIEEMALKLAINQVKCLLESNALDKVKLKQKADMSLYAEKAEGIQIKIKSCKKKMKRYDSLIEELDDSEDVGDIELQKHYMTKQKELLVEISKLKSEYEEAISKSKNEVDDFNIDDLFKLAKEFINHIENKQAGEQKRMLEILFSRFYVDKKGNIKLMLKVGLTDYLLRGIDYSEDDIEVISFGSSGSPMVSKDIKSVINSLIIEFNYYEYADKLATLVYENFLEYLSNHDEFVIVDNAMSIDTSKISQFKLPRYKYESRLKKSIHYQYMLDKYPLHHRTLENFMNGERLSINIIKDMLEINNLTLTDYLEYIHEFHKEMIVDEEVIDQCILISRSVDIHHQPLLKNKIKCVCGGDLLKSEFIKKATYDCENKRRKKCKSKNVKEKDIVIKIESEKDVFIQTYDDVDKLVERIELTNLDGEFRIIYK